jgi:hypothetical protein
MKNNMENEITFYSTCENRDITQIINEFLTHGLNLKPKDIRFKNCLYFLYQGDVHDKNKLIIKLSNGKLYFCYSHKDIIEDNDILQRYNEVHQDWQAFEDLDSKFLEAPLLSFYYKDKYESNFKYDGERYKIVGDDTKFLDVRNGVILSTLQYIEIESKDKFSKDLIDLALSYFTNKSNFCLIVDAYTKQNVGLRHLNNMNTKLSFDDVHKFEEFIYTVFKNIYSNKLLEEGVV